MRCADDVHGEVLGEGSAWTSYCNVFALISFSPR